MSDQVTLTREEYEALRAGTAMVTITAAEYQELKAARGTGIDPVIHQRVVARLAEVEQLLRREMEQHEKEISEMTKTLARR